MDGTSPAPGFVLSALPYAENALEPAISAAAVSLHYNKHHAGYVAALNDLAEGTHYIGLPLQAVLLSSAKDPQAKTIYRNAAQVWNHDFYWQSMRPEGGGPIGGALKSAVDRDFGSEDAFRHAFAKAALDRFGSGWAWLVARKNGRLQILTTGNADTPRTSDKMTPLLVLDVWEHAYYPDYQNRRADYVAAWLKTLANWQFADENLSTLSHD
jgi:superoxide dismutase, Fe-Mn family